MQTEKNLRLVTLDLFEQLKKDNVIYAEFRFAPLQHLDGGLSPQQVVEAVDSAMEEGTANTGIEARIILCTLRHYSAEESHLTAQLVNEFKETHVAGFDIAGDEAGYPLDAHLAAFEYAHSNDLNITAHAGEASGASSVWQTLENLRPSRLGHGVRSIEDADLVRQLQQQQIHLEICPTCNVQIDIFDAYDSHPVNELHKKNISLGISTDSRALTPITLNEEYEKLQKYFGWNEDDFQRCNLNALEAAFISESLKSDLAKRLTG